MTLMVVAFNGNNRPSIDEINAVAMFLLAHGNSDVIETVKYLTPLQLQSLSLDRWGFWIEREIKSVAISADRVLRECHTDLYPYDIAVTAALILFAHHFPKARVTSNSGFSNWKTGQSLVREATNKDLPIPIGEHRIEWITYPKPVDFAAWSHDVAAVIEIAGVPLAGTDGTGSPVITDAEVSFNGVGDDAYDPFCIVRDMKPDNGEAWVIQTYDKPYSVIVLAALILWAYHHRLSDYDIPNPAQLEYWPVYTNIERDAWRHGRDLVARATGISLNVDYSWGEMIISPL